MLSDLQSRLLDRIDDAKISFLKWAVDRLLGLSTWPARLRLQGKEPTRILVDNSVFGHAITHESAWISTGPQKWGEIDVQTGYLARIPVHSQLSNSRSYKEVCYLYGISDLARRGLISLYDSAELRSERFRQPIGRFQGYGYYDLNLFSDIAISSIDGDNNFDFSIISDRRFPSERIDFAEEQKRRLEGCREEPFHSLVRLIGRKNNLDAWHIHTAHSHKLFCFLTMDIRLCNSISTLESQKKLPPLLSRVMLPSQLAAYLKIPSIHTAVFSHRWSSFPVHSEMFRPENRRRGPSGR